MAEAPFDPLNVADVHDAERRLAVARTRCPVSRPYPHVTVVADDEDCRRVLLNPDVFSNHFNFFLERGPAPADLTGNGNGITRIDPPEHGPLRRFLRKWFSPAALRSLEPEVRQIVDDTLADPPESGVVDMFADVARVVPQRVVYALLGLPRDDWDQMQAWIEEHNRDLPRPTTPMTESAAWIYLRELVTRRKASGRRQSDVIDGFLHPADSDPTFEIEDIVQHIRQLIGAGTDTSSALITNVFHRLLENDGTLWQQLVDDPTLATAAVEESLRRDAPIGYVLRTVTQSTEVGGCPMEAHDRVVVSVQSANWDEARWGGDAAEFKLGRIAPAGHLAFGFGIHTCLGAPLARLEARVVLETMLRRYPKLSLARGWTYEPIDSVQFHRPKTLLVDLGVSR